jgi:hypothetical protein
MATSYYQDPYGAPDYSAEGMPSLLSLSNLESLGRGLGAGLLDLPYLYEGMFQGDIDPRMKQRQRLVPSSEQILATTPRMTQPTPQAGLLETAGTFMSPAPMAAVKPLVKGAKAIGKAGLRMAGQEVTDVMSGMPSRSLLGDITPQPKFLDVYHGTPHTLPPTERNPLGEFDASKIGTGEGAQAYGYGIYTAEAPDVAKGYANRLGSNLIMVDGKPMDFNDPVHLAASILSDPNNAGLPAKNLASAIRYDPKGIVPFGAESKAEEIAQVLESGNIPKFTNQKGNLYKVDLPDEKIATMLDWDEPLSKQPKTIQNWLKDSMNPYRAQLGAKDVGGNEPTGSLIYNRLAELMSEGKKSDVFTNAANYGAKNASQELADAGIAGIKYFDEGSRAAGQGTRNFVVFPNEEKSMTILERNGMTGLLD